MNIPGSFAELLHLGKIDELDYHFGLFIAAEDQRPEGLVVGLVAALVSAAAREGHVCLNVGVPFSFQMEESEQEVEFNMTLPSASEILQILQTSSQVAGATHPDRPLVLDSSGRLYLQKFFCYQQDFAAALLERCRIVENPPDPDALSRHLDECFPAAGEEADPQRRAGMALLTRKLLILTGGPGTGKTWTIARGIRLLQLQVGSMPAVRLAAPTGKAAARLTEAMREAMGDEGGELPAATTLHRLLRPRQDRPGFRHNQENQLPDGLYIVDEVSMMDLTLAARFVRALPSSARLVLVGDRHQLASVEAGALLAEIGLAAEHSPGKIPPLGYSLIQLQRSRRFSPTHGIGRVSQFVNQGQGREALQALRDDGDAGTSWRELPSVNDLQTQLAGLLEEGFASVYACKDPVQQLDAFHGFRILAGLRRGPFGVKQLNRLVEAALAERGWLKLDSEFYCGRPVMVTANDYKLQLFNGDIGIVGELPGGGRRVFFPDGPGRVREVLPLQLPSCETVFAMTVHKSQGSEFDRLLLVLPPEPHPLLARELIYTALTRGRKHCQVWGTEKTFVQAVKTLVERHSGLADLLR